MKTTLFILFFSSTFWSLKAQIIIDATTQVLQTDKIQLGTDRYLVYMEHPAKGIFGTSIWERTVSQQTKNGEEIIVVRQKWNAEDTKKVRTLTSYVDAKSFLTLHQQAIQNDKIEAFDFYDSKIVGSDSIENNERKGWELTNSTIPYNWELDIEMFQLLPYSKSVDFSILYYHPGGKSEPTYYLYENQGIENIGMSTEEPLIECHKIFIDYGGTGSAIFWVSTATKKLLKMEETYGPIKRTKIRI